MRNNLILNNIFIGSLKISKELTSIKKNNLSELKSYFNINMNSHRTKEDVLSLLEILKQLDVLHKNKKAKNLFESLTDYKINSQKQSLLTIK